MEILPDAPTIETLSLEPSPVFIPAPPNITINRQPSQEDVHSSAGSTVRSPDANRIRDQVIVYEYLCYRTFKYYSKYSKFLTFPSICISSLIALLNSNMGNAVDPSRLQIVNVIGNSLLTFVITLSSVLKFAEKSDYFLNLKTKFTKLHNKLNNEFVRQRYCDTFDTESPEFISIMLEYSNLDETISYTFPDSIIEDVRVKFKGHHLPTICNGIERASGSTRWGRRVSSTTTTYTIPSPV